MGDKNVIQKAAEIGEVLKQAYEIAQKSNDVPLMEKLFEARRQLLLLQEDNFEIRKKYEEIKNSLEQGKNLYPDGNFYYERVGEKVDGPFCQKCWDADHKKIRLHHSHDNWYKCFNCTFEGEKRPRLYDRGFVQDEYTSRPSLG